MNGEEGPHWPQRKRLPHEVPDWVPDGERYFITINCRERGTTALQEPLVAEALLSSIGAYEVSGRWFPWLMVVMPDHVHLIASFAREPGIRKTISAWKGYFARTAGIDWQAGFFEHRLRTDREFDEKAFYVRENPVRKGLVARAADWPHVWDRTVR